MIFFLLLAVSALAISGIAGWFSITGLAAIFPAAAMSVMLMGAALELGKLVSASWLYRFWGKAPKLIRAYFLLAIIVLSGITSLGIFGFLTKAHIEGSASLQQSTASISVLDARIETQKTNLDGTRASLRQLDAAVNTMAASNRTASRALAARASQRVERARLDEKIASTTETLDSLTVERSKLSVKSQKIEAEVGPLKYIAELVYGESSTASLDKAVRLLTLSIMFVFDPLAILLVIAANMQLASLKKVDVSNADTSWNPDTWFDMVDNPLDTVDEEG